MLANTVDDFSYFLVRSDAVSGNVMDNPDNVYAFHGDFSSSILKGEWTMNNYGKWSVEKERLLRKTVQSEANDDVMR